MFILFVVALVVFTDERGVVVGIWLLCLVVGVIATKRMFDQ